ncbi:GBF-interacting protein 1, partial [Mucuna pruriens]
MSGGVGRGSIPSGVRKTIENIKEITGNHSEDDIYAMLKDCSMDPNETAHKLLFQDTFHEVKRKRDRRKETLQNVNNLESLESRSRPGPQRWGVRGSREKFSPHHLLQDTVLGSRIVKLKKLYSMGLLSDAGGDKNSGIGKDSGTNQVTERGVPLRLSASQEKRTKEKSLGSAFSSDSSLDKGAMIALGSESVSSTSDYLGSRPASSLGVCFSSSLDKGATIALGSESVPSTSDCLGSRPASSSAVCFSSSDPVLVPSNDSHFPGAIRREVGSQCPPGKLNVVRTSKNKIAAEFLPNNCMTALETGSSSLQGKIQGKSWGVVRNHFTEVLPSSTVMHGSSSRPSSNHSNRSQQLTGPQKAGFNKEWKPKSTSTAINHGSGLASVSESSAVSAEATGQLQTVSNVIDSEEATSILQRKMEDLHFPPRQHVKLPNHIFVPDSEKNKFSFGSLGFTYRGNTSNVSDPESEKSSMPASEVSQAVEETAEEQATSHSSPVTSVVGDYTDHPQSPTTVPENLSSGEVVVSSPAIQEHNESKQDASLPSGDNQCSVVHTSPNSSSGFMPPMLGTQSAQFDNSESQAHDISQLPSFVVHQPIDPTGYYVHIHRSGADSDGRLSPFPSTGVTAKYNSNAALLPTPNPQSVQEWPMTNNNRGKKERKNITIIKAIYLSVPLDNQFGFRTINFTIWANFTSIHPSTTNSRLPRKKGNQHPNTTMLKSLHFINHGLSPSRMIKCFIDIFWNLSVLSTAGTTQAVGVMQNPIAVTQQPVPIFRTLSGIHLPHYPPSYIPYGHYFPPFYVTPPPIHQFLGNPAFPQQLQASTVYPPPPAGMKYPVPQFKPGTNAANSTHFVISGAYGSSPAGGYNPSSAANAGNVTSNEDLGAPGQDISISSFYNLPPQGQHVNYAPTQAAHGTFAAGIYHPAQAVTAATVHPLMQQSRTMPGAVDIVRLGSGVYHQPHINWP